MSDGLNRFVFEDAPIRGGIVQMAPTWQRVCERHDYPRPIRRLLGEAVAATALMTANLKGETRTVLQLQGEGAVRLLVVQCSTDLSLRGMAHWQEPQSEGSLFAGGRLSVTLEPRGRERYQGIVPLVGSSLAASLDAYFERSEQLPTRILLFADEQRAAGFLLQALPSAEGADAEFAGLADQLGTLDLSLLAVAEPAELLMTWFPTRSIRLFDRQAVSHDCRCDAAHLSNVVRLLGDAEVESILDEQGLIELTCEFCNRAFRYGSAEARAMLGGADVDPMALH